MTTSPLRIALIELKCCPECLGHLNRKMRCKNKSCRYDSLVEYEIGEVEEEYTEERDKGIGDKYHEPTDDFLD
jgi:hypothetical protein